MVAIAAAEIIGRHAELLALGEFVEAAPAGGRALLFDGDAGIGKTALWQEGVRLARERGCFRVLTARATQSEVQTAFALVGDLFGPVLGETLPRLVPVQRRALEIAFLIREPHGQPPEGRLLGAALLSIVRAIAEDRPLLVAIDDAQWVDTSSAESSGLCYGGWRTSRSGFWRRCVGGRSTRRSSSTAPLRGFSGSRSRRSRSQRSTVCSGAGCRSTWRDRCSCVFTRPRVGTRSSHSNWGARSPAARSARMACTCSYPRA